MHDFKVNVQPTTTATTAHVYYVNVPQIARKILEDCRCSSRSVDAIRHKDWWQIRSVGELAIPGLFVAFLEQPGAHSMAMLREIAGDVFETPEDQRGKIAFHVERWMEWGRKKGLLT